MLQLREWETSRTHNLDSGINFKVFASFADNTAGAWVSGLATNDNNLRLSFPELSHVEDIALVVVYIATHKQWFIERVRDAWYTELERL